MSIAIVQELVWEANAKVKAFACCSCHVVLDIGSISVSSSGDPTMQNSQTYRLLQNLESRQLMREMLSMSDSPSRFHRYSASFMFSLVYRKRLPSGDGPKVKGSRRGSSTCHLRCTGWNMDRRRLLKPQLPTVIFRTLEATRRSVARPRGVVVPGKPDRGTEETQIECLETSSGDGWKRRVWHRRTWL
jgi:hypothetical protein